MELECPKIDFSVIDYMNNENLNILLENEEALLKLVQENPFVSYLLLPWIRFVYYSCK